MIKIEEDSKYVIYNKYYYDRLKDVVYDFYEKNLNDVNIDILVDVLKSFLDNIQIVDDKVIKYKRVNEDYARNYFGSEFINEFEKIRYMIDSDDCQLLIHGTSPKLLQSIVSNGLFIEDTLASTSYACGIDEKYIYSKMFDWQHHEAKGLVLISVPNECLKSENREPILKTCKSEDGSVIKLLKPEFIVGVIDVLKKEIISNPLYKREHDYNTIDLISYDIINPMFLTEEESKSKMLESLFSDLSSNNERDNETFCELFEFFDSIEETDEKVYKDCMGSLMAIFKPGLKENLIQFFSGDSTLKDGVLFELWEQLDYFSILEKLIKIKEKKNIIK